MTDDEHFFSDKPFKFGSGELIIKDQPCKNYQIQMCQNSDTYTPPLEV